ncbi:Arylsulfatase A [Cribrihabitans marinus]|uniref:Arylsulfatase A n=1 Tax=Cribrihabitans marinus TaxID=1227549 RepID=A0A1H6YBM2_9RHOB|nr:alkaline phosphatase family protein [Cribrihabitans marinus]GGH28943.1 phosphonate monoester hydrolase [Cribrihabitans marinus]SEJ38693.1 Arylsulfatase A [Cribrihabitans marinus]
MTDARNILFIMFDQLRWDYLSCAGHPHLHTPHIDALAAEGVRFTRAYVQSPVCGASRMSFYTGRYVHSHGASWNNVPLKVGERTMGDHLREAGMDCWLVGKTHMKADDEGMARLGIRRDTQIGARVEQCGFDIWERDDGLRAEGPAGMYDPKGAEHYNAYLRARGYDSANPWHDFANSGRREDDPEELASGWFMKNARKAAAISDEDSETPYMTTRAIEFMAQAGDDPWCLHLSYIKPHWPYIAPAPYNDMYGPQHMLPVVRDARERQEAHPVFKAFMDGRIGRAFSRDEVREAVVPAYMGLIKQCDDQMGRLFAWLKQTGRWDDTLIVVTSDHGDYLGDHWMGEKDLFHDPSVKVPLIIRDPSAQADATRGTTCEALVEGIDLAPTFLEIAGGEARPHILEGRSLLPWLRGETSEWRDYVVSEYDYSMTGAAAQLGVPARQARLFMIADVRWKFMHADGMRPQLFDLAEDPQELVDLGTSAEHAGVIALMYERLADWARRPSQRTTLSDAQAEARRGKSADVGVLIGIYDPDELPPEQTAFYRGRPRPG